jgi:hypothetical protein
LNVMVNNMLKLLRYWRWVLSKGVDKFGCREEMAMEEMLTLNVIVTLCITMMSRAWMAEQKHASRNWHNTRSKLTMII